MMEIDRKRLRRQKSPSHYNDGAVDFRVIEATLRGFGSPMAVFVGQNGFAKTVNADDPRFTPEDLIDAYSQTYDATGWGDDCKGDYVAEFRRYLIRVGCDGLSD